MNSSLDFEERVTRTRHGLVPNEAFFQLRGIARGKFALALRQLIHQADLIPVYPIPCQYAGRIGPCCN
jgi:hypothetical protein